MHVNVQQTYMLHLSSQTTGTNAIDFQLSQKQSILQYSQCNDDVALQL